MFNTSQLVEQVNKVLASNQVVIPDGKKIAVISSVQNGQANLVVAMKLGDDWHVSNVLGWNHETGLSEGFSLQWSK